MRGAPLAAGIVGVLAGLPYAQPATAQSDTDTAIPVDEIVVEGQRRAPLRSTDSSAATLVDTDLRDLPLSISVISRGLIDAVNTTTTRELIEQSASVVTGSIHSRTFQDIYIRGFSADSETNGALKNGIPFYGVDAPVADPSALERIEVLKGAAGLLFGSAQPGGVINYVYRAPQQEPVFGIRATVGEHGTRRADLDTTGSVFGADSLDYRFTLGWEDSDSWQDFVYNEKFAPTLQLRADVAESTTVSLLAEIIRVDSNPANTDTTVVDGEILELPIETYLGHDNDYSEERTEQVQLSLEHGFTDSLGLIAQLGWNTTKRDAGATGYWAFFGPPDSDGMLQRLVFDQRRQSEGQYGGLHLTWDAQTGDFSHKALVGINMSQNDMRNNNGFSILLPPEFQVFPTPTNIFDPVRGDYPHRTDFEDSPPFAILDWTYTDQGVNLQDLITYEPWNLNFLVGLRYSRAEVEFNSNTDWFGQPRTQFQSSDNDEWVPRAGLVWDFVPNASLFASYGESFAAQFGAPQDAEGNLLLNPERGEQLEAGVRWFWDNGGVTFALYELTKRNVAVATEAPGVSVLDGEQRSRGIEFEASGRIADRFDLYLSYAYTDTDVVDSGFGAAGDGLPFAGIPENKLVFWGFWSFAERWSVGYGLDYQDASSGDPQRSFETPGRTLHQLRLRSDWQIAETRVDVDLEVRNATDERWWTNNFSAGFIKNGEPRGVYLTVTLGTD